jgi:hypothetical protein
MKIKLTEGQIQRLKHIFEDNDKLKTSKSDRLAIEINKSIEEIDKSMSYEDFAIAVAKILNQYGEHNYAKFMEVLHRELGIKKL